MVMGPPAEQRLEPRHDLHRDGRRQAALDDAPHRPAIRRGNGDDDLLDPPAPGHGPHLVDGPEHGHAIDPHPLPARVIVEEPFRVAARLRVLEEVPRDPGPRRARADDQRRRVGVARGRRARLLRGSGHGRHPRRARAPMPRSAASKASPRRPSEPSEAPGSGERRELSTPVPHPMSVVLPGTTVTGSTRVSTPEAPVLDLLRSVAAAGSRSTVATVAPPPGRGLRRGPVRRGGPDRRAASCPAPRV